MLKSETNLMLSSLIQSKKDLRKFYKTGYCEYSGDKKFKGSLAVVNDKAIVSFLQDIDDDSKVIATVAFQDNTTIIIQLDGEDFSRTQFGQLNYKYSSNRESIISDLSLLRRYCAEAEEKVKSSNPHFIRNIFFKLSKASERRLSRQDVKILMENMLDKLNKSRNINNRNRISPKVEITAASNNSTSKTHHFINDRIPEI